MFGSSGLLSVLHDEDHNYSLLNYVADCWENLTLFTFIISENYIFHSFKIKLLALLQIVTTESLQEAHSRECTSFPDG